MINASPLSKQQNPNSLEETIKYFENRQMIYSFLGLLILLGVSIIANNLHLQSVAQQSTKYVAKLIQLEQVREAGLVLEEALNNNFLTITYKSNKPGRSFSMPASASLYQKKSFWEYFSREQVSVSIENPLIQRSDESITFEYNRFSLVPYAFVLWIIMILVSIPQTRLVKRRLVEQFEKDILIEKSKAQESISEEVRHNLRTPLASLMRLPARMPESMGQDRELLKTSINQIRKITAALDKKQINQTTDHVSSENIYDTLYKSINQISATLPSYIQFNSHVDDSLCSAKIPHVPVEFQIILGNIVNNSLDAIQNSQNQNTTGSISIRATDMAPDLVIEIEDNGPGINEENVKLIFEKGFTSGKTNGTGLGLYHAKNWVTQWGGRIHASSAPNAKTTITINLPIKERASWYVPRLKFKSTDKIYVLDDQLSARQLWQVKLSESGFGENIHILSEAKEAKELLTKNDFDLESTTFIFDYDLKEDDTGLDLLRILPQKAHRYLATGHFDKPEIRIACEDLGVFLIPKSEIAELPIIVI